ncbi:putative orfan [Tupanvirus soda lake]|uniref:Orfan n=2 Tax=Tupanvirus TaxID=2094720 RepID=A0AC62ACQ9_9VIRU|nr:putative orfan [Tupanvirus soda lake]QKU35378.1 putative orfan [Tupanvirus soda lake]
MTSQSVIIAGYKLTPINIDNISKFYDLVNKLNIKSKCPKLIIVNRDYDSIDIDDCGIYIAFDYYIMPQKGILDKIKFMDTIKTMPEPLPKEYFAILKKLKTEISEFDIHVDYCDFDRRVNVLPQ